MKTKTLNVLAAALLVLAATYGPAFGQPPTPKVEVVELSVRPAAAPRPALRWRLVPSLAERTPGNAAPYYYRAIVRMKDNPANKKRWDQYGEKREQWLSTTRDEYPREEVRQWLTTFGTALEELRRAARRETCQWDIRPQELEGFQAIEFLLDDIQEARALARVVQLKAHAELMDGNHAEALSTLRLGYRLGSDISRYGVLISSLVGIAIVQTMNDELMRLIEHSPDNYYWALATARPGLVDMREALEVERQLPYKLFPVLRDAATAQRSPEEWRRLMVESLVHFYRANEAMGTSASRRGVADSPWVEAAAAALVAMVYPQAKERLVDQGWDRQKVEAMPAAQVVAIDAASALDDFYDEQFACFWLPYPQARPRLEALEQRLREQASAAQAMGGMTGIGVAMANLLSPALSAVATSRVRIDQQLAMLQTIEALRMHAAQTGQWPDRLADVTIVPVPSDPATEAPFRYRREQDTAILEPSEGGELPRGFMRRYVLRLKHDAPG
jgi:hypothetical protein